MNVKYNSDFPTHIQIQTLNSCNYSCGMCPYPNMQEDKDKMSLDLYTKILEECKISCKNIKLHLALQNEPLIDHRIWNFIDLAHDKYKDCVSVITLVTNGSTLTYQVLDRLAALDRLRATISINAKNATEYKSIHGSDRWEKITKVLSQWQGLRSKIRLSFVVGNKEIKDFGDRTVFWLNSGYKIRAIPLNSRVGSVNGSFLDLSYGHCHYPVNTLTVLANGDVITCCNDWSRSVTYGNISSDSVANVWNSSEMKLLRNAALSGNIRAASPLCMKCDYPMRSSQRFELEEKLLGRHLVSRIGEDFVPNEARIITKNIETTCLVLSIDTDAMQIVVGIENEEICLDQDCFLNLRIGHIGLLNFGALDDFSVQARFADRHLLADPVGWSIYNLQLIYQEGLEHFLNWFEADWTVKGKLESNIE